MKIKLLKIFSVLFFVIVSSLCLGGSTVTGGINFSYDMKSDVAVNIKSDLSYEEVKTSVENYIVGYNLISGDDDVIVLKNIEKKAKEYVVSVKLRRIDKVKGPGDFDFAALSDFFSEGSERRRLIESWANGSWRYSSSVWFGNDRGSVDISREHEGKDEVLPRNEKGETIAFEKFAQEGEKSGGDTDLFLFRLVATDLTMGDISSITMSVPGKIRYYAGNGISVENGKIVVKPTVIKGDILKKDESGEITAIKDADIKIMYGYVAFDRGPSPVAMAAMIVAGAALTGALIALFVCFSKKGKRCKQSEKEKKLSAETETVCACALPTSEKCNAAPKKTRSDFVVGVRSFFRGRTWASVKKNKLMYLIVRPAVIFVLVFNYAPMFGIVIAFQDYKILEGVSGSEWVGFKAFRDMFFLANTSTYRLLRNTLYISIIRILTNFPLILLFALLIREIKNRAGRSAIQTVAYIPYFISWVAVSGIAYNLFSADEGLINKMLVAFGGKPVSWYTEEEPWWWILALSSLWKGMGWSTLIYMSAMGSIDGELYDACLIDGGGRWQQAMVVTFPGIANVIAMQVLMDAASVLSDNADQILAMTNGSASLGNTDVIGSSMIANITGGGSFAQATALGLVQGVVGLIMVFIVNSVVKKTENEGIL